MSSHVHRSSVSQISTQVTNDTDELTESDLIKHINGLREQTKILKLENAILEKAIMRMDPSLMNGIQQAMEYAAKISSTSSPQFGSYTKSQTSRFAFDSMTSPSRMLMSPSKLSTKRAESSAKITSANAGSGPRINVLERSELVSIEIEIVIKDLEACRNKAEAKENLYIAKTEETLMRIANAQKAIDKFKQDVQIDGFDRIAQRIPAEVWIRFMMEYIKGVDREIGKLRLRTSTLNTQYHKLKGQIKTKTELSESLRPVDFEKLKIDNSECEKTINQKFKYLIELKQMTGDANLNLTIHKNLLTDQMNYVSKLRNTIATKKRQKVTLEKEKNNIQTEVDILSAELEKVRKLKNAYKVPDVMDYVKVKSELTDLQKHMNMLKNRSRVQEIALKSLSKQIKSSMVLS